MLKARLDKSDATFMAFRTSDMKECKGIHSDMKECKGIQKTLQMSDNLCNEIKMLKEEIWKAESYSRRDNLNFQGNPEEIGENCEQTVNIIYFVMQQDSTSMRETLCDFTEWGSFVVVTFMPLWPTSFISRIQKMFGRAESISQNQLGVGVEDNPAEIAARRKRLLTTIGRNKSGIQLQGTGCGRQTHTPWIGLCCSYSAQTNNPLAATKCCNTQELLHCDFVYPFI